MDAYERVKRYMKLHYNKDIPDKSIDMILCDLPLDILIVI
jgi:hypothetical protein